MYKLSELTPEQRLFKQRIQIMRDPRFIALGPVMMLGKTVVDKREIMPNGQEFTAYTDGKDVYYGERFIADLDDRKLRFLILHETYHIALMQMIVWRHLFEQDPKMANIAADLVINNLLDNLAGSKADGFIEFIEGGALDHSFDNMDTGEIFRAMKGGAKPQAVGGGEPQDIDGHEVSSGAAGDGDGEESGDEGDGDGAKPTMSEKQLQELADQITQALRQGAQIAGRVGGSVDRSLQDMLAVTVDWREVLRDFVQTHAAGDDLSTWRRPARRWMARDIYMPSRYTEAVKRITLALDTSGSICDEQLRRALSEVKGVFESVTPEVVDVMYWDTSVAAHEVYDGASYDDIVNITKPKGGGGTRVRSVMEYMSAQDIKPDCMIIFTDGYVEDDWGGNEWPCPVLWCVSTKGMTAPTGKTLYVPAF